MISGNIEDPNDNRLIVNAGSFLFNGSLCSLEANRTFQSTTNQIILRYKATRDYDTQRLVFTYKHGEGILSNYSRYFLKWSNLLVKII